VSVRERVLQCLLGNLLHIGIDGQHDIAPGDGIDFLDSPTRLPFRVYFDAPIAPVALQSRLELRLCTRFAHHIAQSVLNKRRLSELVLGNLTGIAENMSRQTSQRVLAHRNHLNLDTRELAFVFR